MELENQTNAIVDGNGNQPSAATISGSEARQPESGTVAPPDWNKDPNFQKWQAANDKRLAEAERKRQAEVDALQRQNQQVMRELEQIRLASMDEEQQRAYMEKQKTDYIAYLETEILKAQQEKAKRSDVNKLAKMLQVAEDELMQFEKMDDAVEYGVKKLKETEQQRIEAAVKAVLNQQSEETPDEVDLGVGLPARTVSNRDQAIQKAREGRNPEQFVRLILGD